MDGTIDKGSEIAVTEGEGKEQTGYQRKTDTTHRLGKIDRSTDKNHILGFTIAAAVAGLLFNVIADPLIGYYYKLWIIGKPAAELTLAWNIAATSINAVTSTIASVVIYMAVRPALRKAGFLDALSVEARA